MPHVSLRSRPSGLGTVVVAPDAWLANRRRTRVWAALAAAWSVAIVVLALLPGRLPTGGPGGALAGVIALYAVLAAAGLALAWRVARSGLWIGRREVVIRGPFATVRIDRDAAVTFSPGLQGHGGNGVPCPLLTVRGDGRTRAAGVWALGRRNVWFRYGRIAAELEPLCDELNRLLTELSRAAV
jgi:hypothetical protein